MDRDEVIAGCQQSHRRLRSTLGRIDDEIARQPSRLPDWTVGHVLTHLARNADSHVRILEGAIEGQHLEQYEGGREQRAADIDAGAHRSASDLIDDVVWSFARLEDTWDRMTPDAWAGHGLSNGVEWPSRYLPFFRWREVEIHHMDMGSGYEVTDWPQDYVSAELAIAVAGLPGRISGAEGQRQLMAWLLGRRSEMPHLTLDSTHDLPPDHLIPGD